MATRIVLTQTASWNPKLTNPYRTRYTTAGGRYFEAVADGLYTPWFIHEILEDGTWAGADAFNGVAFRLADVRTMIAAAVEEQQA